MTIIDRLKMELANKAYFTDAEYTQFLEENSLTPSTNYDKTTMQRDLLFTVVDILEAVCNDVDKMRRVETEFETTEGAYKHLQSRIDKIRQRINTIPVAEDTEANSPFTLMFYRN